MIRIVGGKYRSRKLCEPPYETVRPTQDRIREAVFSALGGYLEGTALDLFAGSGAYGLEALSRGCQKAVFGDTDRKCLAAVKESGTKLGCLSQMELLNGDYQETLKRLGQEKEAFRYVFLDPPYALKVNKSIILALDSQGLLARGAEVVAEQEEELEEIAGFSLKKYQYSYKKVGIYRKKEESL
jgi:16S rRNA (guanine966-N2)-methyltransferase